MSEPPIPDDSQILNPSDDQDAAWAILQAPIDAAELMVFCQDIERLFRINPMLNFSTWQKTGDNQYHCAGQNISQQPPFDFDLSFTVSPLPDGIQIDYEHGLKTRTTFAITPISGSHTQYSAQTKLIIKDFYDGLPLEERKQHLHYVDKSITVWASHLQQYLIDWKKWSHFGLWRWYMRHVWQPLKPMGRRIISILLWLTVFEVALVLLGAIVYFLEYRA